MLGIGHKKRVPTTEPPIRSKLLKLFKGEVKDFGFSPKKRQM